MKNKKSLKSLIIIIFVLLFIFVIVKFIDGYYSERVKMYIDKKTTIYGTKIIENVIENDVLTIIDINDILILNNDGKNTSALINTNMINKVLALINNSLKDNLEKLENENIFLSLPIATIFSETLFSESSFDFKVKIRPVGSAVTDIVTDVKEYGINNSILRIDVKVSIEFVSILPLNNQTINVVTNVPLLIQTIQGEVPRYYFYGSSANGTMIIPSD